MSPPCQPFTRNGNFKDTEDRRTDAFQHICDIVKANQLPELSYILMENVVGFEKSTMRGIFVETLNNAGFHYQEFIISPTKVGVANTRHRYYCIARKSKVFSFESKDEIVSWRNYRFIKKNSKISLFKQLTNLPQTDDSKDNNRIPCILDYLELNVQTSQHLLSDDVLEKRFQVLDICSVDSINSMCFTKSYTRYTEGTGSVFCPLTKIELDEKLKVIDSNPENMIELKKSLGLRFFSPREVLRLMSFPEDFNFPPTVNDKQQYKLLGNSINVAVVCELIKLLFNDWHNKRHFSGWMT